MDDGLGENLETYNEIKEMNWKLQSAATKKLQNKIIFILSKRWHCFTKDKKNIRKNFEKESSLFYKADKCNLV